MNSFEDHELFTIKEISKACGVSRTTLIRMEECGFLKPYRIDENTGYRYYDAYNVSEVGQFLLLQSLGLTKSEIVDYFYQKTDGSSFLNEQRAKLSQMQRLLEEVELRRDTSRQFFFSYVEMPELVCYAKTATLNSMEESEKFFYTTHVESIKAGLQMMGTEALFGLSSNDFHIGDMTSMMPAQTTACIPVKPPRSKNPDLITFPAGHTFSCLAHGDYSIIPEMCIRFWQEVDRRGLTPTGQARFLGLVAPYTGRHIKREKFCYRLMVPVES